MGCMSSERVLFLLFKLCSGCVEVCVHTCGTWRGWNQPRPCQTQFAGWHRASLQCPLHNPLSLQGFLVFLHAHQPMWLVWMNVQTHPSRRMVGREYHLPFILWHAFCRVARVVVGSSRIKSSMNSLSSSSMTFGRLRWHSCGAPSLALWTIFMSRACSNTEISCNLLVAPAQCMPG